MIAGYLTSENGKTDRKKAQKWPDNIFLLENLDRLLNKVLIIEFQKTDYE